MTAEVILIASEASLQSLKASARQIARFLSGNGFQVRESISICSSRQQLGQTVAAAFSRSQLIITLGGMGKEMNYLTKQVISDGLHLPLEESQECLASILGLCRRSGQVFTNADQALAYLPQGSLPLVPRYGIIPGCMLINRQQSVILLPETSTDAMAMLENQVLPAVASQNNMRSSHTLRTYGISYRQANSLLQEFLSDNNPSVSIQPENSEELCITVSATAQDSNQATAMCSSLLSELADRLGDYAYGLDVNNLEQAVVRKLLKKEIDISIAESGTGGYFASVMKSVSPSLLRTSVVVDNNDQKERILNISPKQLKKRGDVSEYAAVAMAQAVLEKGRSNLGVAICADIPGASQREEAQVYVAVCDDEIVYVQKLKISEKRTSTSDDSLESATLLAFNMIRLFVDYLPNGYPDCVPLNKVLAGKVSGVEQNSYESEQPKSFSPSDFPDDTDTKKPKKNKKTKIKMGKVKKAILTIAIVLLVGSLGFFGLQAFQSYQAIQLRDDVAEIFQEFGVAGVLAKNSDTVGYIYIPETTLSYPVVQSSDNDYYLRRNFNQQSDSHGVPFMDAAVSMFPSSQNMVIYGHNMRDGQIFGELLNYKNIDYYREHPLIYFDTLLGSGEYKILSVFVTNSLSEHGDVFRYDRCVNLDNEQFQKYVMQVQLRSLIDTGVDAKPGDQLITLSTCDYDLYGARFVVVARKVRMGESAEVDTAAATINPTPLMPDVWYTLFDVSPPPQEEIDAAGGLSWVPTAVMAPSFLSASDLSNTETIEESEEIQTLETVLTPVAGLNEPVSTLTSSSPESSSSSSSSESSSDTSSAAAAEQARLKAEQDALAKKQIEEQESQILEFTQTAKNAMEMAQTAQASALSATSSTESYTYTNTASDAAKKAKTAASSARSNATKANTELALKSAENAEAYATQAQTYADTAQTYALSLEQKELEAAVSSQAELENSTASVSGNSSSSSSSSSTKGGSLPALSVSANASFDPNDTVDIISRIVQNEVGSGFHPEAIKAQAVASYTYILEANSRGQTASVYMSSKADQKVIDLVNEVLGEAVYYNGKVAFTPYFATSSGATTTSASVWGQSYPYLISVDSSVDLNTKYYSTQTKMSSDKVSSLISSKLGITTSGDPSLWFEILSEEPGGYNGKMSICGETKSAKTGSTLTGRLLRENVFGLRSAAFDVEYDSSSDQFIFTTYGYGHGVGLSQNGANFYAQQGWSYQEILQHYYPGTSIQ